MWRNGVWTVKKLTSCDMRPLRIVRPPRPGGAGGSSAGSVRVKYTVSYSVVGLLCKWVCRYCWWRSCSFCTQIYPKNAVFGSGCVHVTNFWIILQQSLSPVLIRRTCTQRSSSDIEIVCIHSIDMSKRVTGCVRSTRWTVNAPAPITQKQLDTW